MDETQRFQGENSCPRYSFYWIIYSVWALFLPDRFKVSVFIVYARHPRCWVHCKRPFKTMSRSTSVTVQAKNPALLLSSHVQQHFKTLATVVGICTCHDLLSFFRLEDIVFDLRGFSQQQHHPFTWQPCSFCFPFASRFNRGRRSRKPYWFTTSLLLSFFGCETVFLTSLFL